MDEPSSLSSSILCPPPIPEEVKVERESPRQSSLNPSQEQQQQILKFLPTSTEYDFFVLEGAISKMITRMDRTFKVYQLVLATLSCMLLCFAFWTVMSWLPETFSTSATPPTLSSNSDEYDEGGDISSAVLAICVVVLMLFLHATKQRMRLQDRGVYISWLNISVLGPQLGLRFDEYSGRLIRLSSADGD